MNKMFTEFAIAKRLFNDMTSQVKTEVSADQARVITIQYIAAGSETETLMQPRQDLTRVKASFMWLGKSTVMVNMNMN